MFALSSKSSYIYLLVAISCAANNIFMAVVISVTLALLLMNQMHDVVLYEITIVRNKSVVCV
jgi:hypothetical protein